MKMNKYLQRIQVECLTVSVVAFVVTVELIALRGKMTDVARQEWRPSLWEKAFCGFPRQNVGIPPSNVCNFASQRKSIQPLQRTRQLWPLNTQPESAVMFMH